MTIHGAISDDKVVKLAIFFCFHCFTLDNKMYSEIYNSRNEIIFRPLIKEIKYDFQHAEPNTIPRTPDSLHCVQL